MVLGRKFKSSVTAKQTTVKFIGDLSGHAWRMLRAAMEVSSLRCSRTSIIVNIISKDDSSNVIHTNRFDPLLLPAVEIQYSQIR